MPLAANSAMVKYSSFAEILDRIIFYTNITAIAIRFLRLKGQRRILFIGQNMSVCAIIIKYGSY